MRELFSSSGGSMEFMAERMNQWQPLEKRTFKYKSSAVDFFCPLCRTQRHISISHKLTAMNYIQMTIITGVITASTYPWFGLRGIFSFFMIWPAFELVRRTLFKKEVPCPHCGFDASWYKRDVKRAKAIVEEFWQEKSLNEQDHKRSAEKAQEQNFSEFDS